MKFKIKLIAIFLALLGCCINLTAQIAYHDAIKLEGSSKWDPTIKKVVLTVNDEMIKVFTHYDSTLKLDSASNVIIAAYKDNPFISIDVAPLTTSGGTIVYYREITPIPVKGIFDTTTVVEGLSKFLVKRVKEELSVAFFKKFQDEIHKPEYDVLKVLFPETYKMLDVINEEIYKFSSYIQVLREAFKKDLSNIYSVLPDLLDLKLFEKVFQQNPQLKDILKSALKVIIGIKAGKHPGEILDEFNTAQLKANDDISMKNLGNLIDLLKILSTSLRQKNNVEGKSYWIKLNSFNELFQEDLTGNLIAFKIYLGLIYQNALDIKFEFGNNKQITFREALQGLGTTLSKTKDIFEGFAEKVVLLESYLEEIKKANKNEKKLGNDDYYNYCDALFDTIEYTSDKFKDILGDKKPKDEYFEKGSKFSLFLDMARAAGDIYMAARQNNYSSLVYHVIGILDKAIGTEKYSDIRKRILKYGAFMAALAEAENSDQVQAAIESVALPVGSASIKRNSSFNISLNAYVGATVFKSIESSSNKFYINKARVWTPIGIALSFGRQKILCIKSLTLFASVIDIGAVTAFRFRDEPESDEKIPKFTFKNIVSPGLHAVFGIKNSPISFGVGYQRLPQLREITITKNEGNETIIEKKIDTDNLWKWNFFIAVDIPLLNFVTK